jgi:hypothetical protein
MNNGWFVRKITIRRWLTQPDWLEPRPSVFGWRCVARFLEGTDERTYQSPSWLKAGDVSGDCLKDLATDDGNLSIFFIPSNQPELVHKVGAAMIAGSQNLARFEYCRIEPKTLEALGFRVYPSPASGATIDPEVNALHHDVVDLSAEKLVTLAVEMKRRGKKDQVKKSDIKDTIRLRVQTGRIQKDRVTEGVRKALGL